MELWKVEVEDWSSYYVIAKDGGEAVEKVREHIIEDLTDSGVDFKAVNIRFLDDDVIS